MLLLRPLLLLLTVPPAFTATSPTVSLPEDTQFSSMQWAMITSAGTGKAPPSNAATQTATQGGPTFSVVPTSSCSMLSAGPSVSSTGFLSFSTVENGFGVCSFNVTLCDSVTCSTPQRLVIDVAAGRGR
jgi:hypothetical protein